MGSDIPTDNGQQQEPQEPQETALHPAWQSAFDAIPEDLRESDMFKGLTQQIRESEKNARKAIEDARGQAPQVDEDWAGLMESARENGLTAAELVDGFNASASMRDRIAEDPEAFLDSLEESIVEAVKRGDISVSEGSRLLKKGEKQVDEVNLNPTDDRVDQLQKRLDARERAEREQQDAWAQQQAEQEAMAEAEQDGAAFVQAAEATFESNGFSGIPNPSKAAIAQYAANLMESGAASDPTAAMQASIDLFKQQFNLQPAAAPQGGQRPPIGGGSGAIQSQAPQKFASDKDREAAMIAEAIRLGAAGD